MTQSEPAFEKDRHIKYWKRCHDTYLPSPYTASDSTRLMWACFTYSALDILYVPLDPEDAAIVRTWVLNLQHPQGGFCGSPAHGHKGQTADQGHANLAATFFALVLLAVVAEHGEAGADAYAGVNRQQTLSWLRQLQRDDGSFGQNMWDGQPVGGRDTRHSYLASSVRWMLRGDPGKGSTAEEEDIDVEAMIKHIRRGQTYDGGLAEASSHESHAGYAYCSVAALSLLDRPLRSSDGTSHEAVLRGTSNRDHLLKFLADRQFVYLAQDEEEEGVSHDAAEENFIMAQLNSLNIDDSCEYGGFNGRCNKKADTCYCWWAMGTLRMLDSGFDISASPARRYLLEITQHRIGGFSKVAGAPPDLYHAYLGLAGLALLGESGIKEFDVGLCCSTETTAKIERARAGLIQRAEQDAESEQEDRFWEQV
ncbi:farnesyltransferase geranylgeranyltransferase type-1 subunit alpha [Emericellopsis cladophorae]|uniref:Farnesyltransferase geranylgeranyltransferase type-1 subunit alpha n=1 Tax=Emericellopsis cladophorae TaxID=2686198 RepID=A0A9P9XU75_9HYPO|nr:farnesyltransferase geranylgeranyltransferase type-1 subunit alpha [Emericellopsis cladophorae]KAI6777871.1 farnesyltransferase geranylgeranyltransferase type-1 subunit alpha [Emericellopsis cladophorae]